MSGIDRVGGGPPRPEGDKSVPPENKGKSKGASFDEVLDRKSTQRQPAGGPASSGASGSGSSSGSTSGSGSMSGAGSLPGSIPGSSYDTGPGAGTEGRSSGILGEPISSREGSTSDRRAASPESPEEEKSRPAASEAREAEEPKESTEKPEQGAPPPEWARSEPATQPARAGSVARIPPELITRLVESMRLTTQAASGRSTLTMDLKGTVFEGMTIRLQRHQGTVSGVFLVDRLASKEAIEAQLVGLRERLEAQGLQVGELKVELRGQFTGEQGADERRGSREPDRPPEDETPGSKEGSAGRKPSTDRPAGESETDYTL